MLRNCTRCHPKPVGYFLMRKPESFEFDHMPHPWRQTISDAYGAFHFIPMLGFSHWAEAGIDSALEQQIGSLDFPVGLSPIGPPVVVPKPIRGHPKDALDHPRPEFASTIPGAECLEQCVLQAVLNPVLTPRWTSPTQEGPQATISFF